MGTGINWTNGSATMDTRKSRDVFDSDLGESACLFAEHPGGNADFIIKKSNATEPNSNIIIGNGRQAPKNRGA
jgi:hypothetical protein